MAMHLNIIIVLATLLTANAFFLPDCLWDSDSWDIPEERSRSRRYRRFLWDDSDVCDWLCDPDLLPHEICNTCCRRSATSRPLADQTPQSQNTGVPQTGSPNPNPNLQPAASPWQPQVNQAPNAALNVQQTYPQPNNVQFQVRANQNWPPAQINQNWQQQPLPQNQNWQQQPLPQNQNWQQQPLPQNQNWQQQPLPLNQNWQQQPQLQNQNWQQLLQPPSQNWEQSTLPNQNWPQLLSQNQNGFDGSRVPPPQNWNSQPQLQVSSNKVPAAASLNNEHLNVQVPINLTGLIQAQVPSRLTQILQNKPLTPAQNGQFQGVPPTNVGPLRSQSEPPTNGPGLQNVMNGMSNAQNQQNGLLPSQPQSQPESSTAAPQQNQPNPAIQQFQTAGQQVTQTPIQPSPQSQNQQAFSVPLTPVMNELDDQEDEDVPDDDDNDDGNGGNDST